MKALSGGLIIKAATAFAFLRQYDNGVPILGMEKESQLDQFVAMEKNPPALDEQMKKMIAHDWNELSGTLCRAAVTVCPVRREYRFLPQPEWVCCFAGCPISNL
jgi:hypothetical protein